MKKCVVILTCLIVLMCSGSAFGEIFEDLETAERAFNNGNYLAALSVFTKVIDEAEETGHYPEMDLAKIYHMRGATEIKLYYSTFNPETKLGNPMIIKGAIEDFKKSIELGLEDEHTFGELGLAYLAKYMMTNDLNDSSRQMAKDFAAKAINKNPDWSRAYIIMCTAYTHDIEVALASEQSTIEEILTDCNHALSYCAVSSYLEPNSQTVVNLLTFLNNVKFTLTHLNGVEM